LGGIEQELPFWYLLVCCVDGQDSEEGGRFTGKERRVFAQKLEAK